MKNAEELFNEYINNIGNPEYLASIFAEDGAIELPYMASMGKGWRTVGKENIQNMLTGLRESSPEFRFLNVKTHIVTPNQVFAEYEVDTLMIGKPYKQLYMGRLVAENGKIKLVREGMDLVAVQKVFGT